jgi:NAD(P)-dependent dehydrogenase (short-subunit alcohol dehydrogenase family)
VSSDGRVSLLTGSGAHGRFGRQSRHRDRVGSGHGIGRGEALELAAQGAKVVINDLGGSASGEGADKRPADEVVEVITATPSRIRRPLRPRSTHRSSIHVTRA